MNNRSNAMAVPTEFVTLAPSSPHWRCHRLLLMANTFILRSRQWLQRIFFTSRKTIHFLDGNKRTGANAAITFLLLNDVEPTFTEDQLVEMVLGVAQGRVGKNEIERFFAENCRPLR
jgi:hypothetical protein